MSMWGLNLWVKVKQSTVCTRKTFCNGYSKNIINRDQNCGETRLLIRPCQFDSSDNLLYSSLFTFQIWLPAIFLVSIIEIMLKRCRFDTTVYDINSSKVLLDILEEVFHAFLRSSVISYTDLVFVTIATLCFFVFQQFFNLLFLVHILTFTYNKNKIFVSKVVEFNGMICLAPLDCKFYH